MSGGDAVDSAIQYAGIPDEPSNLNSNQPIHTQPTNPTSSHDDDQIDESDPSLEHSPSTSSTANKPLDPSSSPNTNNNRLSLLAELRSPTKTLTSRASLESLSFGYRDHLLPLTLSGADDDESFEAGGYGELEGNAASRGVGSNRSARRRNRSTSRPVERRVGLVDGE